MSTYETVFITTPNLSEEDERATVDAMAEIVNQGGGEFIANDRIGRRRLAYPIKKFEDGVYLRFLYDSAADVPKELERRFRLSDNVLRYLTVALEKDWAVAAKEQAVRDAQRREEAAAEAERQAAAAAEAAEAAAAEEAAKAEAAEAEPTEAATEPPQSGDDAQDSDDSAGPAADTAEEPKS